MTMRRALLLGLVGFGLAVLLFGKSARSIPPAAAAGVQWREVDIGAGQECLPVALSAAALREGLMGIRAVLEPMVFDIRPAKVSAFWMHDTRVPLSGVWVNDRSRVFGYWHGRARSDRLHRSVLPVSLVMEYAAGAQLPRRGTRVFVTSAPCNMGPGL